MRLIFYRANGRAHLLAGKGASLANSLGFEASGPSIPPSGYAPSLDFSKALNSQYFPFFFR